ncbi:sigma-70 family RNA polymerase sigma factor [Microbacterium lacus]|uniref:sigma-70 family RNA polymerase sigma factor n=1 Tax=Microbacterium lacus TaxID=415217 RepID=UPI003851064C
MSASVLTRTRLHETPLTDLSDEELVDAARSGDNSAYAVLWQRHAGAARRAARSITHKIDPDDLVSEAFTKVLVAIRNGNGPREGFRAYLFTAMRNASTTWGSNAASQDVTLDHIEEMPDAGAEDAVATLDERSLLIAAFKQLPERTRTLLWYLEVEGMKPREIAPLMGLKPNAVSAAAMRAREAFRHAWLGAHIADPNRPAECKWVCERLLTNAKKPITRTDKPRYDQHLDDCSRCQLAAGDIAVASAKLRAVLLPLYLGGPAAAVYSAAAPAPAAVALAVTSPTRWAPWAIGAGLGTALIAAAAFSAGTGELEQSPPVAAESVKIIDPAQPVSAPETVVAGVPEHVETLAPVPIPGPTPPLEFPLTPQETVIVNPEADTPLAVPAAPPVPPPSTPPPVLPRTQTFSFSWAVSPETLVPPLLSGTGDPGATVSVVDELGTTLASTLVDAGGTFLVDISGDLLRQGMSVSLVQVAGAGVTTQSDPTPPLSFAAPELVQVRQAKPVPMVDADGDGVLDDAELRFANASASARTGVSVSIDGGEPLVLAPSEDPIVGYIIDAKLGSHTALLRYVDADGRQGIATEERIVVAAAEGL